ncbi:MAG: cytidine deaminase [Anaeromicrobium sp.]|jgi:cytidine deaminase|uniref:cytidine deaminase n=1 Tax=Anaeromicrobium sp. TaxID=1929132 RepID=UPI0025EC16F2|nr:cytidine deaminase [Anaeromicrobium sp.]MCT4594586.1 cytidine deaminase [Anaeromicrobium sp.]
MTNEELMEKAIGAKEFSHSPYSNFRVGAALLTKSGKAYTGCNVECASYGGTNCAERTAIFKAVSEGHKDIEKIAITSDLDDYTFPCGICRQVIVEFGLDIEIILSNKDGKIKTFSMGELLPHSFTEKDLKK